MSGPFGSTTWVNDSFYNVDYSVCFDDADNDYMNRTLGTASDMKIWTYSVWFKRSRIERAQLFCQYTNDATISFIELNSSNKLHVRDWQSADKHHLVTTATIAVKPGRWYHLVVQYDTNQGTAADRLRVYIDGTKITGYDTETYPAEDFATGRINSGNAHYIGYRGGVDADYDGYMAEIHFLDGVTATPSSFARTINGVWRPLKYMGSHGDNGFYLPFDDSSALGDDESANTNDWSLNNLGATNQMVDSPTLNMNQLSSTDRDATSATSLVAGGLVWPGDTNTSNNNVRSTLKVSSGKWYCELYLTDAATDFHWGVHDSDDSLVGGYLGSEDYTWAHHPHNSGTPQKRHDAELVTWGAQGSQNDILQMAFDVDDSKIWWGVNNTWYESGDPAGGSNEAYDNLSSPLQVGVTTYRGGVMNFGADSSFEARATAQGNVDQRGIGDFYYTPPSGFLAICEKNGAVDSGNN